MGDRKYSIAEIDRMRGAVEHKWLYGFWPGEDDGGSHSSRCYKDEEKTKCVEEILRTYMLAGTDPEELCAGKP